MPGKLYRLCTVCKFFRLTTNIPLHPFTPAKCPHAYVVAMTFNKCGCLPTSSILISGHPKLDPEFDVLFPPLHQRKWVAIVYAVGPHETAECPSLFISQTTSISAQVGPGRRHHSTAVVSHRMISHCYTNYVTVHA